MIKEWIMNNNYFRFMKEARRVDIMRRKAVNFNTKMFREHICLIRENAALRNDIERLKEVNHDLLKHTTEARTERRSEAEDKCDILSRIVKITLGLAEQAELEDRDKYEVCEDFTRQLFEILENYSSYEIVEEVDMKLLEIFG